MVRYSLATSIVAILSTKCASNVQAHEGDDDHNHDNIDAWSYLPVTLPTPLSDMAISVITITKDGEVGDGSSNSTIDISGEVTDANTKDGDVKTRVIITGGCDSPDGNQYVEEDWGEGFACFTLSNKVSFIYICMCICSETIVNCILLSCSIH